MFADHRDERDLLERYKYRRPCAKYYVRFFLKDLFNSFDTLLFADLAVQNAQPLAYNFSQQACKFFNLINLGDENDRSVQGVAFLTKDFGHKMVLVCYRGCMQKK